MTEIIKKILTYGISGAITLVGLGWGAKISLDDAKAEYKAEILDEVKTWRKEDMTIIQAIKEDTTIIKQALINRATR